MATRWFNAKRGETLHLSGELDGMKLSKEPCTVVHPDVPQFLNPDVEVHVTIRQKLYLLCGCRMGKTPWKIRGAMSMANANSQHTPVEIADLNVVDTEYEEAKEALAKTLNEEISALLADQDGFLYCTEGTSPDAYKADRDAPWGVTVCVEHGKLDPLKALVQAKFETLRKDNVPIYFATFQIA